MRESKIENKLKQAVERLGGMCIKFPPIFFKGFPDRIVLLPGGVIFFVELKQKGKNPTGLQTLVHNRLRSLGFAVSVLDDVADIDNLIISQGLW